MKHQTDILFVCSPTFARDPYPPFFFLYLAAYLEKGCIASEISNPHERTFEGNLQSITRDIRQLNPGFIGLSCFVTDFDAVVEVAKRIRSVSDAMIVVGNAHASIAPRDFLYDGSPFDVVVIGEGELTLTQLISMGRGALSQIAGIAYWDEARLVVNPKRELMNPAGTPVPDYHKIDMEWYATHQVRDSPTVRVSYSHLYRQRLLFPMRILRRQHGVVFELETPGPSHS